MVVKIVLGIVLAASIGVACRWFGISLPGPPAILGAVLAVAMATGYTVTDRILTLRHAQVSPTPSAETRGSEPDPRTSD